MLYWWLLEDWTKKRMKKIIISSFLYFFLCDKNSLYLQALTNMTQNISSFTHVFYILVSSKFNVQLRRKQNGWKLFHQNLLQMPRSIIFKRGGFKMFFFLILMQYNCYRKNHPKEPMHLPLLLMLYKLNLAK